MTRVLDDRIKEILKESELDLKDNVHALPTLLHYFMMYDGIHNGSKRDDFMDRFVKALRQCPKLEVREYVEGVYMGEIEPKPDEILIFRKCDIYLVKNIMEDGYRVRIELSYI